LATVAGLPPYLVLDPLLRSWLVEDVGRGDRTTQALFPENAIDQSQQVGQAEWMIKESGIVAGLPVARRVFQLLSDRVNFVALISEGKWCEPGTVVAQLQGSWDALLMGERVALNLVMRLSGIATLTRRYVDQIADLPAQLVDTRKTTPGLRLLEKYATQVGGAVNHRMGLDDAVMIKDNHILAAGGIGTAITQVRAHIPYPLTIEVETETLADVEAALQHQADIIMLDNMSLDQMKQAVQLIHQRSNSPKETLRVGEVLPQANRIKIEASGNITLETIRAVAETGVDYISTSAPITRSTWLDYSMNFILSN
jgi:nicotinate-nucleotide pyrophosphorylase (carboxylating)